MQLPLCLPICLVYIHLWYFLFSYLLINLPTYYPPPPRIPVTTRIMTFLATLGIDPKYRLSNFDTMLIPKCQQHYDIQIWYFIAISLSMYLHLYLHNDAGKHANKNLDPRKTRPKMLVNAHRRCRERTSRAFFLAALENLIMADSLVD